MNMDYVLGFAFDREMERVLLIEKTKPAWQAGKLNGIGGKVESYDSSYEDAICREFQEEAGLFIHPEEWKRYATLQGEGFTVAVFFTKIHLQTMRRARSMTEEEVGMYSTRVGLRSLGAISNVPALIELAVDPDVQSGRLSNVVFSYK